MYAVMYRTVNGVNVKFKELYRTLDDAEEGVLESQQWLTESEWLRAENSSLLELTDGSCFVIFQE